MERLDHILHRLKGFALTRPVAYGAPSFALAGVLAGLFLQMGPQDGPYVPEMERVERPVMAQAAPIVWPTGDVPDYVIGTDALRLDHEPQPAIQYADYEPPPAPELPPYIPAEHGPAAPPPSSFSPSSPDETRWASTDGDIVNVSLPEDAAPTPPPTVVAAIATYR